MAYRIRSLSTMTVHQVNDIFLRGRGLSLHAERDARDEDFTPQKSADDQSWFRSESYVAPATVIDDDLEAVR